jgi:hypothetical protein
MRLWLGRRDVHDDLTDAVNQARPERGRQPIGVLLLLATGDEYDPLGPEPLDLIGHLPYPASAENDPGGRYVVYEIHWLQPVPQRKAAPVEPDQAFSSAAGHDPVVLIGPGAVKERNGGQ